MPWDEHIERHKLVMMMLPTAVIMMTMTTIRFWRCDHHHRDNDWGVPPRVCLCRCRDDVTLTTLSWWCWWTWTGNVTLMRCQERHHPHHHLILITIITNLVNTFIIRSALHYQHSTASPSSLSPASSSPLYYIIIILIVVVRNGALGVLKLLFGRSWSLGLMDSYYSTGSKRSKCFQLNFG